MMAQGTEITVAECFLTSVCEPVSSFLIGSHTMPAQRPSQPTLTFGSKAYARLGVTCQLHF